MLRWYLVHTKPFSENTAVDNLLRQGFEVYFPRLLTHVRRARRWQDCICALFPRYLFVGVRDDGHSLGTVRSTRGIAEIVRFGLQYKPVPDGVLSDLRSRADPASGLHRVERDRRLRPGCAVRIDSGPLDQLEGIFERESDADRVHVLLRALGQAVSVQLPRDAVMIADS